MSFRLSQLTVAIVFIAVIGIQQVYAESHGDEDEGNNSETAPDPAVGGENDPGSIRSGAPKSAPNKTSTTTTPAATTAATPTRTAPTATMTAPATASIVASLNAATSYCKQIKANEYMIDCLAERLEDVNHQIENLEGYKDVSDVLGKTADSLNQIARQNRSDTLQSAWFSAPGNSPGSAPIATERALIPVDESKMADAMAQALTVIEDAETTLLLRSSEESADRAAQYQRIASAIGSNKVLLRSS